MIESRLRAPLVPEGKVPKRGGIAACGESLIKTDADANSCTQSRKTQGRKSHTELFQFGKQLPILVESLEVVFTMRKRIVPCIQTYVLRWGLKLCRLSSFALRPRV